MFEDSHYRYCLVIELILVEQTLTEASDILHFDEDIMEKTKGRLRKIPNRLLLTVTSGIQCTDWRS